MRKIRKLLNLGILGPIVVLVWLTSLAVGGLMLRIAITDKPTSVVNIVSSLSIDSTTTLLAVLAIIAVVGGLIWIAINSVYKDETIDDAVENAQDVREVAEDVDDEVSE